MPEPYDTLCANVDAPARRIYQHWGWQQVAHADASAVGSMDVLMLDLRQQILGRSGRASLYVALLSPFVSAARLVEEI